MRQLRHYCGFPPFPHVFATPSLPISLVPPRARRVMHLTECPCLLDADRGIHAGGVTSSGKMTACSAAAADARERDHKETLVPAFPAFTWASVLGTADPSATIAKEMLAVLELYQPQYYLTWALSVLTISHVSVSSAHPTLTVWHALRSARAYWMLIGACNSMGGCYEWLL